MDKQMERYARREPHLHYEDTWSGADAKSDFDFQSVKITETYRLSRLGRPIGTLHRDLIANCYEARTTEGRYVGTFDTPYEAAHELANW